MEALSGIELIIFAVVSFLAAILSGISSAGAELIMVPALIFFGLSPAEAVATVKVAGLSISLGSLSGLKGVKKVPPRLLLFVIALTIVIALGAPQVITGLNGEVYKKIIGAVLLVTVPIVILTRIGRSGFKPTSSRQAVGAVLLVASLMMHAVFSAGGYLIGFVFMGFFGLSALQANVAKRYSQAVLSGIIILGLLSAGIIVWPAAIIGAITTMAGGFIGGKMAAKRGNKFVLIVTLSLMSASAIWLLLS